MSRQEPAGTPVREPPPPYVGEGPFALWHFSEDPDLGRFQPHTPAANPGAPPLVWAVDTRHAPMFWFPRDCPRGCAWPVSATTPEDRERFFGQSGAGRLHVMESAWLGRMQSCRLYAYRLPEAAFRRHDVGGRRLMRSLLRSSWLSSEYFVGRVRVVDWSGARIARGDTADGIARLKADQ